MNHAITVSDVLWTAGIATVVGLALAGVAYVLMVLGTAMKD